MKKLISILAAVSMVMMFGTAAFATECNGCDAEVGVAITVEPYAALLGVPDSLVMDVNDIQAPGGSPLINEGTHQASTTFTVQGNVGFVVTLTVNEATTSVIVTPGSIPGDPWPTARRVVESVIDPDNAIGYGVSLSNLAGGSGGWNPPTQNIVVGFGAGQSTGKVNINTYLDSGRSDLPSFYGGFLARPGLYKGTIFLTLSI